MSVGLTVAVDSAASLVESEFADCKQAVTGYRIPGCSWFVAAAHENSWRGEVIERSQVPDYPTCGYAGDLGLDPLSSNPVLVQMSYSATYQSALLA